MAIKMGAFELYTQERKLPEKGAKKAIKTSHFFDDMYKKDNHSQLVHERLTSNEPSQVKNLPDQSNPVLNDNINNGSQLVHIKANYLVSNTGADQVSEFEKLPRISFSKLVGNQRTIIIALYKNMKINKSDTTDELTLETISKLTGVNQKSLKNTLFRLNNAEILIRADQKVGRGGWVKYKINVHIIRAYPKNRWHSLIQAETELYLNINVI